MPVYTVFTHCTWSLSSFPDKITKKRRYIHSQLTHVIDLPVAYDKPSFLLSVKEAYGSVVTRQAVLPAKASFAHTLCTFIQYCSCITRSDHSALAPDGSRQEAQHTVMGGHGPA